MHKDMEIIMVVKAQPFLLDMLTLTIAAMGFSAILISLSLSQLLNQNTPLAPDKPILIGTWMTLINFIIILIFTFLPLLAFYTIEELRLPISENTVWRFASILILFFLSFGLLMMIKGYKKRYAEGCKYNNTIISIYMLCGAIDLIILIILNVINTFIGLGSMYLLMLFVYLIGILIWVGLIMRYYQKRAEHVRNGGGVLSHHDQ